MEEKRFPLGTKVKLKTGSRIMTVRGYRRTFNDKLQAEYNYVVCVWEDGKETHEEEHDVNTLEAIGI